MSLGTVLFLGIFAAGVVSAMGANLYYATLAVKCNSGFQRPNRSDFPLHLGTCLPSRGCTNSFIQRVEFGLYIDSWLARLSPALHC